MLRRLLPKNTTWLETWPLALASNSLPSAECLLCRKLWPPCPDMHTANEHCYKATLNWERNSISPPSTESDETLEHFTPMHIRATYGIAWSRNASLALEHIGKRSSQWPPLCNLFHRVLEGDLVFTEEPGPHAKKRKTTGNRLVSVRHLTKEDIVSERYIPTHSTRKIHAGATDWLTICIDTHCQMSSCLCQVLPSPIQRMKYGRCIMRSRRRMTCP